MFILWKANKKRRIKFSGCFVCSFLFLLLFVCVCGERCLAANEGHLNHLTK